MKRLLVVFSFVVFFFACKNDLTQGSKYTAAPEVKDLSPVIDSIGLRFTAFKTPKRVGVPGTFKEIEVDLKNGKSLKEALNHATFVINTKTVDTGVAERDAKLTKYFFGLLSSDKIEGGFQIVDENSFNLVLEMNGIKKTYLIEQPLTADSLKFNFTIDVLSDFEAAQSLDAINTACFDLHEGKTWSEVDVEGYIKLK